MLSERFGIDHTTLQVDHERAPQQGLLTISDRRKTDQPAGG